MRSFLDLVKRFHSDERGVFAVIFGIMAIVLVATAGAVVDYTSMETARTRAQVALDAAVLGLAPTIYDDTTEDVLMARAEALVIERVNDSAITVNVTGTTVDKPNGTLRFTGTVTVPMAFVQLVGIQTLTASITAEATKGSINLEVAVALDNTGSMKADIPDLKEALDALINLVVNDVQEPTYSKMALAPYAAALNVGDKAADIRGDVPAGKTITNMNWAETGLGINAATKANPVVITTAPSHGYLTGDIVYINGVKDMTQLNDKFYKVVKKTATTFALQTTAGVNVNGTSYGTYTAGNSDKVRRCIVASCEIVVKATAHGFATGDYVRTTGTNNNIYNDMTYAITNRSADTFSLNGTSSTSTSSTIATNGSAYCTQYGCEYYYFLRDSGVYTTFQSTDCVTERATNTYTEDPPSTTPLGANYTGSGDCDIDLVITPLTSDKDVLYAQSAAMTHHGATAGHIGTAWAWYLVSPEFGYLWDDAENIPAAYGEENLLKIVIIMTDGAYNTQHCNGVETSKITCDAPATAFEQAAKLCDAMKEAGITVYTVGFDVGGEAGAAEVLLDCASDPSMAFLPDDGADLIEDFETIGQHITQLRLSM